MQHLTRGRVACKSLSNKSASISPDLAFCADAPGIDRPSDTHEARRFRTASIEARCLRTHGRVSHDYRLHLDMQSECVTMQIENANPSSNEKGEEIIDPGSYCRFFCHQDLMREDVMIHDQ